MSLSTPTTKDLSDTLVAQLQSSLAQTLPIFPKAFLRVLAWVLSGVVVVLYKYCGFIFLQLFIRYASDKETTIGGKKIIPLVEWCRLVGEGDPLSATRAEVKIAVPVTTQTGTLKAGSRLQRASTGILYTVIADVPLNAANVNANVRASGSTQDPDSIGAGSIGNLSPGDVISFVSPYANVGSDCTVVAMNVQGADAELTANYRKRGIQRFQRKPQGGAYADYQQWGKEVPGIVNVYPYTSASPGQDDVYCEADEASSGSADGIPTGAQLNAVRDSINLNDDGVATRRPANAALNIFPITRLSFGVTVSGLSPNTPENQSAIDDAVDEYLRSAEPYIVGLSVLPRKDRITQAAVSGTVDGVVNALGASVTEVIMTPGPAYTLGPGEKAKLTGGACSYT